MGITLTNVEAPAPRGHEKEVRATGTWDATYVNGTGETVTAASLGLSHLLDVEIDAGPYIVVPTISTDKTSVVLKAYYGDNNNAADGPLIESANADLSAQSFKIRARGW